MKEKTNEIDLIKTQNSESIEKLKKEWLDEMRKRDEESRTRERKAQEMYETQLAKQEIESLRSSIQNLKTDLSNKELFLSIAKSKANGQSALLRLFCGTIALSFIVFVAYKVITGDWNLLEPITYIIGLVPVASEILVMMVFGKSFNPIECLYNFWEYRYKKEGAKYSVSDEMVQGITAAIEEKKLLLKECEDNQLVRSQKTCEEVSD